MLVSLLSITNCVFKRFAAAIEFIFRDTKQFVGLNDCQARDDSKLDYHSNFSLSAVNIARKAKDQNLQMQTDALTKVGCEIIFTEIASGAKTDRVELDKLLTQIHKDDTLVVYKLDHLGRSLKHLLELVTQFNERQIGLQSISDAIDTTTPQVRLFFNISACFAFRPVVMRT